MLPMTSAKRFYPRLLHTLMIGAAFSWGAAGHGEGERACGQTIQETSVALDTILPPENEETLQRWVERCSADLKTLEKRYRTPLDPVARTLRREVMEQWQQRLAEREFSSLERASQIDYLLLRSELEYRLKMLELNGVRDEAAAALLPYADAIVRYCTAREDVQVIEASEVAAELDQAAQIAEHAADQVAKLDVLDQSEQAIQQRLTALRASELIESLTREIRQSHQFYDGYNPEYSWWAKQPVARLLTAVERHRIALREKVVGVPDADKETIIGLPIGREGLRVELDHEWIAHDPAELIELAHREMAWCDQQMAKASAELGCGDDWRAAMDIVKSKHVRPGEQPKMIHDLAWEAIRFLESHDLITVPPLAANGWRMLMMSPERQRVNPYFLGGDSIIVSFPTDTMTQEEKLMSMRSNNEHFSRATVHHELIPGHHLQYHMLARYRPYREMFATPFWMEGWALYWEMYLWDLDFAHGPEDRVGMLFWRKHRCARIIFSLSYHLGEMTPEECVDYLVERVGHERSAAVAEVRRSIMGGYSPLYQAAYMLGGLQLRRMHAEFVQSGEMTNRQFHDAIMQQHSMPIETLRLALSDSPLSPETGSTWKFAVEDAPPE